MRKETDRIFGGWWPLTPNLVLLAVGEVASRIITLIAFIHLARVLGPQTYGLLELTLAVMMVLTLGVDLGLGTVGARDIARDPASECELVPRVVSLQIQLVLATVGILLVSVLALGIRSDFQALLLAYGASLLLYPFLINWVYQGRLQMGRMTGPQVLRWAVFAAFVLLLVQKPEQVLIVPVAEWAAVGAAVCTYLILFRRSGNRLLGKLRLRTDRRLILESLPIGASQLIWALRMYLPTIILASFASQMAVGFFAVSHRVLMALQTLVNVYFVNFLPDVSRASILPRESLSRMLSRSLHFVGWPTTLLALAVSLNSQKILEVIFGEAYAQKDSAAILTLLIWMIPILSLRRHARSTLIALDRQREEMLCSAIGVLLLIGSAIPLTLSYGGIGICWAMLSSELVATGLTWWRVRQSWSSRNLLQETAPAVDC